MPKPPRPWTVLPHRPLERLEDNLYAIEGYVPGVPGLTRRMAIVRRTDGSLLFYNAVPVDEEALAAIRALGTPAMLVVPQHLHMIDANAFRERLGVRVYAPRATRDLVARRVAVDGALEDIPPDPAVSMATVAGFRTGEAMAIVRSGERVSLVVADVVLNVPNGPGLRGLVFRVLGLTGDRPKLPAPIRLRVLRDRGALCSQLEGLSRLPGLARIVTSHGPIVADDPAKALREIAASL
ncbi:MAG TPA: hypothetical protein VMT17_11675 [Anaeromyxobacteraceae bacterium]|nr:hypothetical protein [Anaeromyxobacteraceae bacterium]